MLFTGDTLFPGGPGNTNHDAQDFATIINLDRRTHLRRLWRRRDDLARPRRRVHHRTERPHLDEWVERGW